MQKKVLINEIVQLGQLVRMIQLGSKTIIGSQDGQPGGTSFARLVLCDPFHGSVAKLNALLLGQVVVALLKKNLGKAMRSTQTMQGTASLGARYEVPYGQMGPYPTLHDKQL